MLPEKFKERMKALFDEKEYNEFIDSFDNDRRYHGLRLNTLKCDEAFNTKLDYIREEIPWQEGAFYYTEEAQPGKHPYHEAGLYYIQEPSAMAPVHFLDPRPGEKILDLCAAPGGKSTQIAARLKGEGILVTNEINKDRASILSLNIERLGIQNALVLNEAPDHLADVFEGYFDKILVDAPCSGEGMFRKNDNASDEWSEENVRLCAARQEEILNSAVKMLSPGGRLVYSTCTFSREEDEEQVYKFLTNHPDFYVEDATPIGGMVKGSDGSIRLWPHKVRGEGHFLCVFRQRGEAVKEHNKLYVPNGRNMAVKGEKVGPLAEFIAENLIIKDGGLENGKGKMQIGLPSGKRLDGVIIAFGDQLYLTPENMPGTSGFKVKRAGLHLGTVKKDRFEPSHALALFLGKEDVKRSLDLPSSENEVMSYLNGQTIRCEDKSVKGWMLITTDGYSIGWAKASNGMLKNHYPKGLRINL